MSNSHRLNIIQCVANFRACALLLRSDLWKEGDADIFRQLDGSVISHTYTDEGPREDATSASASRRKATRPWYKHECLVYFLCFHDTILLVLGSQYYFRTTEVRFNRRFTQPLSLEGSLLLKTTRIRSHLKANSTTHSRQTIHSSARSHTILSQLLFSLWNPSITMMVIDQFCF